jgi:REP element-mobilizing transposase RayT
VSRPLRYNVPGGLYHVTARGNERCDIVRDDRDRFAFVALLAKIVLERQWILHAWVLMTNHLHLVLETPLANLSEGMHDLLSPFASRFNDVHRRVGHLFQHRFDARPVERETHLLNLVRYVPLNPVRAGLVRAAEEWTWSSYRATAGYEQAPPWLEIDWTLRQFHSDRRIAQALYREFVTQKRAVEYDPHAEAVGGWILGSPAFCERVQAWVDEGARSREHPKRQRRVVAPELSLLIEIIERRLPEDGSLSRWSHGPGRKLIADLGHEACGRTFTQLAETLGITPWGAAKLRARSRELERSDAEYATLLEAIRRELYGG